MSLFGNVQSRAAQPHPAHTRYIALLDVLGMKAWLERDSAQSIAESLDVALVASVQSSCGTTKEGVNYGPIVEVTHFSDSLLAWTPDDSWASLGTLCSSIKMIVGVALKHGVPLRGSIAHGEVVCNKETLRFVGQPIAEAYQWAEGGRPFKSVGVDISPQTIAKLRKKIFESPIPKHWEGSLSADVIQRNAEGDSNFIWHKDCLFVNHWAHGMFVRANPGELFLKRGLPVPSSKEAEAVESKVKEAAEFYGAYDRLKMNFWERDELRARESGVSLGQLMAEAFQLQQEDHINLDYLRKSRH